MWAAIGIKSNEIYARGESKAEVFRKLQRYYPTFLESEYRYKTGKVNDEVYPEPLRILKVKKVR